MLMFLVQFIALSIYRCLSMIIALICVEVNLPSHVCSSDGIPLLHLAVTLLLFKYVGANVNATSIQLQKGGLVSLG